MHRRDLLKAGALVAAPLAAAPTAPPTMTASRIEAHDRSVADLLKKQIRDKSHKYYGSFAMDDGLYWGHSPGTLLDVYLTAYVHPQSKYYRSAEVAEGMRMAAVAFGSMQTKDGNWNLPTTNFNSPPDTAFIMQAAGLMIGNARKYGFPEVEKWMLPAVERAGDGLVKGGIHTPNHRWVATSALSILYSLYKEPKYLRRAEQWLAETIDIDADGQYTERSTVVYNGVCNRALTMIADKLGRMEYLDPVRKNVHSMLYLTHADGEAVTEISRRQDLNTRGTLYYSWLGIAYLAWKDQDGVLAAMARSVEDHAGVSNYLSFPQLVDSNLPASKPMPDNYEKAMPVTGAVRVRRGEMSATILRDRDRFFTFRQGEAIVQAVRFSSAFFGKGQFRGQTLEKRGGSYVLTQHMDAGYYQPFVPTRKITTETYDATRRERQRTEVCELDYAAELTETPKGFDLRIRASGTDEVPVTVEINLREGGTVEGAEPVPKLKDAWVLRNGTAVFRRGKDAIRIGPAKSEHTYLEVRGALPRLEGSTLYVTAFTPVDQVIRFERV